MMPSFPFHFRRFRLPSKSSFEDSSSPNSSDSSGGVVELRRRSRSERTAPGNETGGSHRAKVHQHRSSCKKARRKMMENPYTCTTELDEMSPDDSIIDYSVFSDGSFVLLLLLTSKGDAQAYLETGRDTKPRKNVVNIKEVCSLNVNPVTVSIGSQAAFVVFGLADGNMLVIPIKLLIDVSWGGSSWSTINVIDLSLSSVDPCLAMPTCVKCFTSNFPVRTFAVMTNKAGFILLVDLQLRKCVYELRAPQTVHEIEPIFDENSIELLVSGFTGAQWIIPLETNGRGIRETLTSCVPSDLQKLNPAELQFSKSDSCGVLALNSAKSIVEGFPSFQSLANSSKWSLKIPPETWMTHSADNVMFTVSSENELRSAVHFGFMSSRLEYSLIRTSNEWRPLGIIAMPPRQNKLPGIFVVNERGLIKVEQSSSLSLLKIASEFIFRLPTVLLNSKSICQVANACRIDTAELQVAIIPNLLSNRKNRRISSKDLAQILLIAKTTNHTMSDLLKVFDSESMGEQLLPEVLNAIQANPAKNDNLMQRVVEMFVKRAESADGDMDKIRETDSELLNFLARHENLHRGAIDCARTGMWKCTQILVQRSIHETKSVDDCAVILSQIVKNGSQIWKNANSADRLQIMSLVCHLDWSKLSENDGAKICAFLSAWQRDISLPSYHEMCLRVAKTYLSRFARPCQILSIVSSIYIISEKRTVNPLYPPEFLPLAGGHNCGAAIAEDDRILIWGNFTNMQHKALDISQLNSKSKKSDSSNNVLPPAPPKPDQLLPRFLDYPGGRPRAIACGVEHILILSSSGQLSAWGGNRYGQCGVGHAFKLSNHQQLDGNWPSIQKISCGQFHSAFICSDGSLWTFGWGMYGQLGQGGRKNANSLVPIKVNGLISKIKEVSCGRAHTVVLTENGRVLVCGSGSYGQMGSDDDVKKVFAFTPLDIEGCIVKHIATSFYHSICVTEDNRLFEWGRNPQELKMRMFVMKKLRSAQIKNEETANGDGIPSPTTNGTTQTRVNMNLPAEIPRENLGLREVYHLLDGKINSLSCGLAHSALITSEGTLYTWGKALDFQLGHGNKVERSEPHQVFDPSGVKWSDIACGNCHTLASTTEGAIYGWGKNEFSQCGTLSKKPNGNANEQSKKFYFQAKDGRRFMPTVDDAQYIQRPVLIPDTRLRIANSTSDEEVDEDKMVENIKNAEITVIQAVSRHLCSNLLTENVVLTTPETVNETSMKEDEIKKYEGEDGPLCTASALVHLISGDVKKTIRMVEWLKNDSNTTKKSLTALSSLIWEVIANHEDVQSREALAAAFKHVPMSNSLRKGKQIAQLWPMVWNDESVQNVLSIDEKIAMLDGFTSAAKPTNCATISSSSLDVSSRIRVFAQCAHAEPALVGTPPECSACTDEWAEKVRATLGDSFK